MLAGRVCPILALNAKGLVITAHVSLRLEKAFPPHHVMKTCDLNFKLQCSCSMLSVGVSSAEYLF